MKSVIYARVSTAGQTTKNQLLELREVARKNGWTVVDELTDDGICSLPCGSLRFELSDGHFGLFFVAVP